MKDYDQELRVNRVKQMNFVVAERLIYEWVKTGVISLKQYQELNHIVWADV